MLFHILKNQIPPFSQDYSLKPFQLRTLLTITTVLWLSRIYAQDYKVVYKAVPIMSEQRFYLNGGARADFGGKSRETLLVNLPPNTVEWYYAYTSSANQNQTQIIGVATQLIRFLPPEEEMLASVIAKLIIPTGAGVCDVYLLEDKISANDFVTKKGQFSCDLNGSRQNFKDGVVRIKYALRGRYILGIRNPNALEGVNVNIEIAAIVATRVPVVKSPTQGEASLFDELGEKAYGEGEYDKCIQYEKKANFPRQYSLFSSQKSCFGLFSQWKT